MDFDPQHIIKATTALVAREIARTEEERAAERASDAEGLPALIAKHVGDALAPVLQRFEDITQAFAAFSGRVEKALDTRDGAASVLAGEVAKLAGEVVAMGGTLAGMADTQSAAIGEGVAEAVERAMAPIRGEREGDSRRMLENELKTRGLQDRLREAIDNMPAPVKGDPGEPGAPGTPGDKGEPGDLSGVAPWTPDTLRTKGAHVWHEGSIYRALRDTDSDPTSGAWECVSRGWSWGGLHDAAKSYVAHCVVLSTSGANFVATKDIPAGVACPGDGWSLMTKQGQRGRPGEDGKPGASVKGDPGRDAPHLVRITKSVDGATAFLSDGSQLEFPIEDDDDGATPIRRFRETYMPAASYARGDVVTMGLLTYVARRDVRAVEPNGNDGGPWACIGRV